jgi:hypothetical protein
MSLQSKIGVFVISVIWSSMSLAKSSELKWTHYGLRPLGMGNAYVAVADDYNALFYNPAGLARLKTWDGELLNPTMTVSQSLIQNIMNASELASDFDSTEAALAAFQEMSGQSQYVSIGLTPHLIFKGFGFGIGIENVNSLIAHNDIEIEANVGINVIAPISYARSVLDDRLSLGITAKFVGRGGVDETFNIEDLAVFSKKSDENSGETKKLSDYAEGGYGVGVDTGLLFTPSEHMEPTIGISITDIGGTPYQKASVVGTSIKAPAARLPSVNTGISFKPWSTQRSYILLAADSHAINHPVHYSHKVNFGFEWGFLDIIKLQTGLKGGYLTAGLQFDIGLFNLRAVTYAEDRGPVVGLHDDLIERRYALQLKLLI